jgi:hypothetical protein
MSERRAGLETAKVSAEPAIKGRRPPLVREASNERTGPSRRGSGVDMRAKDSRVNTGDPFPCAGEGPRNRRSARTRAGRGWKSERPIRAMKRVTIVERRGLGSRVRSEGTRARAIGEKPSNLNEAFSRSSRPLDA